MSERFAQSTPRDDGPNQRKGAHIQVQDVGRCFDGFWALKDITMDIAPGTIAVVIGGSGAGKTTLLRLLIGLDQPTTGHLLVDGQDISSMNDRQLNTIRRHLGMVFQYSALLDSMTVLENVAFPLREHRPDLKEKEVRARVSEKLRLLGIEGSEEQLPSELSGGMRKRAALARALMLEPDALFYDEPTSGLDPITARMVDRMIVETRDKFGVTSVVISHDMAGALQIADEIYLLSQGQLVDSGPPRVIARGNHPLARAFFQASGIAAGQSPLGNEREPG
jgi:phospholipid/cholesterol/gamma-HCH transport system ATP-binding protein